MKAWWMRPETSPQRAMSTAPGRRPASLPRTAAHGQGVQLARVVGHHVGLAQVHHLKAMLDGAQEEVITAHLFGVVLGQQPGGGQGGQRLERAADGQPGEVGPVKHLERLDVELQFPDAAGAALDFAVGPLAQADLVIDTPLEIMDFGDQAAAMQGIKDQWADHRLKGAAKGEIAGHHARLEHRQTLP